MTVWWGPSLCDLATLYPVSSNQLFPSWEFRSQNQLFPSLGLLRRWKKEKCRMSIENSDWKAPSHVWLCNPMEHTVHGILQTRILEWVAVPFSIGSSQLRGWTQVSCIVCRFFTSWATREASEGYERENGKAVRVLKLGPIVEVTNLGY